MAHRHNRFNSYNFLQRSMDRTTENNQNAWIEILTVTRSTETMKKRPLHIHDILATLCFFGLSFSFMF